MKQRPLYLFALDPTHIGAGGYRLGRVDMTLLRDAATGLPKIPGSSISGATRAAAIYSLSDSDRERAIRYAREMIDAQNKKRSHRGEEDPVAKIFGYAEGDSEGEARIGMVSFRDAEILALPVPTMSGPRWITTAPLLRAAGCAQVPDSPPLDRILVQERSTAPQRINLGWLLLESDRATIPLPAALETASWSSHLKENLVLVHPDLFPSLVNSNLETRTSVSIDFETGSGVEGALFTYEATPRGTLYRGQIDFDDQRFPHYLEYADDLLPRAVTLACGLGLGAMTTRGFGRMEARLVMENAHV